MSHSTHQFDELHARAHAEAYMQSVDSIAGKNLEAVIQEFGIHSDKTERAIKEWAAARKNAQDHAEAKWIKSIERVKEP